jgi:hypothetical protein
LDHYTYSRDEEAEDQVSYFFFTDNHIYTVVFDPYQYSSYTDEYPTLLNNGIGLSFFRFDNNNIVKQKEDPKIASTICQILKDYLAEQTADVVLLYHCDHKDHKQKGRSILFSKWNTKHNPDNRMIKREIEFDHDGRKYYLGYITSTKNDLHEKVDSEFDTFAMNIVKDDADKPPSL